MRRVARYGPGPAIIIAGLGVTGLQSIFLGGLMVLVGLVLTFGGIVRDRERRSFDRRVALWNHDEQLRARQLRTPSEVSDPVLLALNLVRNELAFQGGYLRDAEKHGRYWNPAQVNLTRKYWQESQLLGGEPGLHTAYEQSERAYRERFRIQQIVANRRWPRRVREQDRLGEAIEALDTALETLQGEIERRSGGTNAPPD
jgi:hypothetical protein